jgi:hypothetical protein
VELEKEEACIPASGQRRTVTDRDECSRWKASLSSGTLHCLSRGGGVTCSGLCSRAITLAAVWRRSWIWERLKAGSPVRGWYLAQVS